MSPSKLCVSTLHLAGMLGYPLVMWSGLKASDGSLGELSERDHHGLLHDGQPALCITSCLQPLCHSMETVQLFNYM